MEKLDGLFIQRDGLEGKRGTATLSNTVQEILAEFLSTEATQADFDKDIFTKFVDTVKIKSRDHIIFVLRDGTEIKADISAEDMAI